MAETDLPNYVRQLRSVFGSIGKRIEELIMLLNEIHDADQHTQALADQINQYLTKLEKSIKNEKVLAKNVPLKKRTSFLELMHQELILIRDLEAYITLSKRKPKPEVILKINNLYLSIRKELDTQENLLKAA